MQVNLMSCYCLPDSEPPPPNPPTVPYTYAFHEFDSSLRRGEVFIFISTTILLKHREKNLYMFVFPKVCGGIDML